jgi:uncharacterized iron-regulated membrane protein
VNISLRIPRSYIIALSAVLAGVALLSGTLLAITTRRFLRSQPGAAPSKRTRIEPLP